MIIFFIYHYFATAKKPCLKTGLFLTITYKRGVKFFHACDKHLLYVVKDALLIRAHQAIRSLHHVLNPIHQYMVLCPTEVFH